MLTAAFIKMFAFFIIIGAGGPVDQMTTLQMEHQEAILYNIMQH